MTLNDALDVMLNPQYGVMNIAIKVASAVSLVFFGFLGVGFSTWAYKVLTGKEAITKENILSWLLVPAVAFSIVVPSQIDFIAENGEGILLGIVKGVYRASADIVDRFVVPQVAKLTHSQKAEFTELASHYREVCESQLENVKQVLKEETKKKLKDPPSMFMLMGRHNTFVSIALGVIFGILGAGKEVLENIEKFGSASGGLWKLLTLPTLITAAGAGVASGFKFFFSYMLLAYALDLVWRMAILLWFVKASALLVLAPISAFTTALEFRFGEGNVLRFFTNLVGLAITPLAMIAILVGGIVSFPIATSVAGEVDSVALRWTFEAFMVLAYPLLMAIALLRVGEIVSYVVGTSVFAISSVVSAYTRPTQILREVMPR